MIEKRIDQIRCFLLDMDGTFYLGDRLLPGALEFMDCLAAKQLDYLFLTNNSSKSAEIYTEKIRSLGFNVPDGKVFTSGEATAIYLNDRYPDGGVYLVGTAALEKEFLQAGIQLDENQPHVVVLGFDTTITYQKIWKICDFIRAGLPYIATHPDFNCPTESGYMPDTGSFIELIRASTGRLPDAIIGKPNSPIVESVIKKTGFEVNKIAMVGDRLYTDIAMGSTGIATILTLSGETKKEDLVDSPYRPDLVVKDLGELAKMLKKLSDAHTV